MSDIGVIAIGRNEGERLRRCLVSVLNRGHSVVYVDSNSSDGSAQMARDAGAEVVALDLSIPFSAARARNEGFERLLQIAPGIRCVQFVDGDCEVVDGWIEGARNQLEQRSEVAVVCGRRLERFPEHSVYNRLAHVEWNTPTGEARSCGGDAMMRVEAFRTVGGFDASVVAGEEPQLCQRLRDKGYKILRIDADMTIHDSAMLHFSQWWQRAVRSGYGAADVATRFGRGRDGLFVHQVRSARLWGLGWPVAVLIGIFAGGLLWGPRVGAALGIVIAATMPLQMLRTAIKIRRRTDNLRTALAYGFFAMISKWANLLGQLRYLRDRRAGRNTRLIEYKLAAPAFKPISR